MSGSSFVIGFHAVEELLQSDAYVNKVFVNVNADKVKVGVIRALCKEKIVPLQMVPVQKLNKLSRQNHQGIIAITSPIQFVPLEETVTRLYESGIQPRIVIADGVQDVRNLGAISRSCKAFGVHLLICGIKSNAEINDAAVKSSAGALLDLPVARVASLKECMEYLQSWGLTQIAASEKSSTELRDYKPEKDSWCLWLGNEDKGLSRERLSEMDVVLRIPMSKETDSLNVSVAAGIMLYSLTS